jgi:xanthine dehydrogenase small subunit
VEPFQNTIRFLLDKQVVEIDFREATTWKPSTTVLNFLRSLPGHKGVKEGCGEGDCGACTVVLAEVDDNGNLRYFAADSCLLFLPMIHGKQLITIENLAVREGNQTRLHPVQQALVDHHGTQCGYCTPGMVMSVFSLFKNHRMPDDTVIRESLAGNLCRCTGYQSILDAARSLRGMDDKDQFSTEEPAVINVLNQITRNQSALSLQSPGQFYLKPFRLKDALVLRKTYPDAIIVNGSTDVALRQTKKREKLGTFLDISDVRELKYIKNDLKNWSAGAGVSLEALKTWSEASLPSLHHILSVFGSTQIRNLATLGGNIGSASPIGDTIPLLLTLDAGIRVRSVENERLIPLVQFITGYRQTALTSDELITEIVIPKHGPDDIIRTYKVSKRTDVDISTVSAAFRLKLIHGVVSEIRIAYGGMAGQPKRVTTAEEFLAGKQWNRTVINEAMQHVQSFFTPVSDTRAGALYRSQVSGNLLLKFFTELENGQEPRTI